MLCLFIVLKVDMSNGVGKELECRVKMEKVGENRTRVDVIVRRKAFSCRGLIMVRVEAKPLSFLLVLKIGEVTSPC